MKDSGVEWLGDVPRHWSFVPLCSIAKVKSLVNYQDRNLLSVYLDRGVIPFSDVQEKRTNVTSEDLSKYQAVDPGDFVLNNQQAWRGSVGVSKYTGIVSPAYMVLCLNSSINPEFANLLFRERTMVAQYLVASKGVGSIQRNLYWPHLKRVSTPLPPLDEQAAIVRYLDHVDRRVRRLVRAKRKLIALLNEQKQAIIYRAVTRGLDPGMPLKDSGIEWLGEVPENWELTRFKFVAAKIVDCLHATPKYSSIGEFPAIRTADISPGIVRVSTARKLEKAEYLRWVERLEPEAGDVLYSREGERFGIAACVPPQTKLCISQRMMVFRIRSDHNSTFIMWLLNSPVVYAQAIQDVMGATAPHVNVSTIRNYALALPPRAEQDALVKYIDLSTQSFTRTINDAVREIQLLDEYRIRLIADVVTGKIDVREAAAALPEVDPLDSEGNLEEALDPDSEIETDDVDLSEEIDE